MSTDTKPELVEVDFNGTKVNVSKEHADLILAERTKHTEESRRINGKLGELNASKTAAENLARQQAEEKEALKLAKDGEIGKVKEMLTADARATVDRLSRALVSKDVKAAVATACPDLDSAARADICALVLANARSSKDDPTSVEFLKEDGSPFQKDGKPATADDFVADFLANRKHFQSTVIPGKTGGKDRIQTQQQAGKVMITAEAWKAKSPREQSAFNAEHLSWGIIPKS